MTKEEEREEQLRQDKLKEVEDKLRAIAEELPFANGRYLDVLIHERNLLSIKKYQLEHPVHLQKEAISTYSINQ